ncbi:MAG TPA: tyrosinase family protein [Gammaproteobacteria bacterium]|nr:tyrosinase family protein [Gammaproteobacteria bacterium]
MPIAFVLSKHRIQPRLTWLLLLATLGGSPALADDSASVTPISISVAEFAKDPAKVASLKKAFTQLRANSSAKTTSATYRTSFDYWANTHGYFGNGKHATNLKAYIAYRMPGCLQALDKATCDHYYAHMQNTPVPKDGFTDDVWGTCQHGNLNFLPWHRMYLHFYSRTLRKLSGDPNLALPYWNYYQETNPALKGLALPVLVRGTAAGTLYDEFRTIGLNDNTSAIDPDDASAAQAFDYNDFIHFSNTLQGQPHGVMHCAVGTGCATPDLGFVPIAGLDPVFYMHHANIDRLWQCWLNRKAKGATIDLAWAKANLGMPDSWYNTRYTFADENGDKATMTIADVFTPGVITTHYDVENNCDTTMAAATEKARPRLKAAPAPLKAHAPLSSGKPVALRGKSETVVPLAPQTGIELLAMPAPESAQPGQTFLLLENVQIVGSPALTYKIYLANKDKPEQSVYIATFNLFGAGHEHGDHHGGGTLDDLMWDVTEEIRQLGVKSAEALAVRFVASDQAFGKLEAAGSDQDGVTIGNIRLETMAGAKQ